MPRLGKWMNWLYWLLFMLVDVIFFPYYFAMNRGIEKSDQIWLMICLILMFIFLDGFRLCALWGMTVIAYGMAYWVFVAEFGLIHVLLSYASLTVFGTMFGLIIRSRAGSILREQETAEERGKEIEAQNNSKTLYFANMSHEIRTPINTIIGLNEMNLKEKLPDDILENSKDIQSAGNTLLALVNDILDWSKLEAGKMEIVPVEYELAGMIKDLINSNFAPANEKGLDFMIDIDETIPSVLLGDEVHIRQIVNNILANAVKYTSKGSVSFIVSHEKINEKELRLKISVEDTGIGIKKDDMEGLFTVFKRADREKSRTAEGTGLGLCISAQLVKLMGGSISVASIYQKGSAFTVQFVQTIIDAAPIGVLNYNAKKIAGDREGYRHGFTAPEARVLVVDDNEMNLMVAKKLLRDTKMMVDLAKSGRECLEKTLLQEYHLIFMDHMMPELDGEETLRQMKARKEGCCKETPVIALTANLKANAKVFYREKGFDGYLAKPISGTMLEAALLEFLPPELISYTESDAEASDGLSDSPMVFHRNKKKIAICATDVCDMPEEWLEQYDIKTIPSYIRTKAGRFAANREVATSEVLEFLAEGNETLSLHHPEEMEPLFADRLTEAEQVLFFCMSSNMVDEAYSQAAEVAKDFIGVTVTDSRCVSTGMALLMREAAILAEKGYEVEEILAALEKFRKRISTSFVVDSVDLMYKNRYIGKGIRNISKALSLHPVLYMRKGKLAPKGFIIGSWDDAAKKYIHDTMRSRRRMDDEILLVTYTGLTVRQFAVIEKELKKYKQFQKVIYQQTNAAIAAVCDFGTFGLVFLKKA